MRNSKNTQYFLVIDQGTSSTKLFLFDKTRRICFSGHVKHKLHRPAVYHVESNPSDIIKACKILIDQAMKFVIENRGLIISMGIAVQRSTFLFWDKESIEPLTPAISWQDSRAQKEVEELSDRAEWIRDITGTPLSAHFGGPKFMHLVRRDNSLRRKIDQGSVWFGPLSAFLTHSLTGKAMVDESIAGRTLLMNLDDAQWDSELCDQFKVPMECLPPLAGTVGDFGSIELNTTSIPLVCVIGDQQAALIGQGGTSPGSLAMNFGTSGSIQFNTGSEPGHVSGLISSILSSYKTHRQFMLEGTINACNSLFYWLESELNIPHKDMKWHKRCKKTNTTGTFVPGFVGLAAPYWNDRFDTTFYKLEKASTDEIIRAAMESIGFLVYDIYERIKKQVSIQLELVTVSGGGARPALLQFLADLLQIDVGHTVLKDRTALGVLSLLEKADKIKPEKETVECDMIFKPQMDTLTRTTKINQWYKVLQKLGVKQ